MSRVAYYVRAYTPRMHARAGRTQCPECVACNRPLATAARGGRRSGYSHGDGAGPGEALVWGGFSADLRPLWRGIAAWTSRLPTAVADRQLRACGAAAMNMIYSAARARVALATLSRPQLEMCACACGPGIQIPPQISVRLGTARVGEHASDISRESTGSSGGVPISPWTPKSLSLSPLP